jgi:rhodanese-related sulfurtransferase
VFETLGRVGLWVIAGAFLLYIVAKWWQRELFIWQLRMDRVDVDELRALMDAERAAKVIDVRSPMSQALTGRIPGAITVDPKNMRVDLLAIEPESEVIVYCACPNEYTAAKVAKALMQHGFKRVRPLQGGIDAWIAAGHRVEPVTVGGAKVVPLHVRKNPT